MSHHLRLDVLGLRQQLVHLYQDLFSPVLETYQLTQMEADILLFLANNPEYDTAAEIVSVRQLAKSHVSTSVEQLVQKGFLTRSFEEGNKKNIHLKLLPAAQPVVQDGRDCQRKFGEILAEGIDGEDMQVAGEVFLQMLDNIKKYKERN